MRTYLYPLIFLISFVCAIGVNSAVAASRQKDTSAEGLTNRLLALNRKYLTASTRQKPDLFKELLKVTSQRRNLLSIYIEDNPGEVLRVAVPDSFRANLPAKVKSQLEQSIVLDGELEIVYEDRHQDSSVKYFLKTAGDRYSLHFARKPPMLQTGERIRVTGLHIDEAVVLESVDSSVEILTPSSEIISSPISPSLPVLPNTLGEQKTIVVLVNFQDNPTDKPWTISDAYNMVFGSVSDFYKENSYGQTWFSGDVYGWYTIPVDSTNCDTNLIESEAKSAATAAGADLSLYNRFIYMFPQTNACTWAGVAWVGGIPTKAFINGVLSMRVIAHELGHNMGLYHAHGLNCDVSPLGDNCLKLDAGDRADIMGGRAGHFNGFHKEYLGYLNSGASPPITTVQNSGTYTIDPFESNTLNPKALKILKSVDPTTGLKTWYYLEYRQLLGFDNVLNGVGNLVNGIMFRTGGEDTTTGSYQLDMTPNSVPTADYGDLDDGALPIGQSYSDPFAGVTITTSWLNSSNAGVNVSFAQPVCAQANPTIGISPSQSQWVSAGVPVTFTVTVTDNDSLACSTAQFALSAVVPSGWTAVFTNPTLNLAPGANTSTTLTVTSPTSAADGFYDITVTAKNSAAPSYTATATATYVVQTVQNPVAVNDSAATLQDKAVIIAVLLNDSDPNGRSLIVDSVSQGANGKAAVNADGTVTYTPNSKFSGRDKFTYHVTDGVGSATAAVSVSVKRAGTKK